MRKSLSFFLKILSILALTAPFLLAAEKLTDAKQAEEVFEQAWNHPDYTQIELQDIDINLILNQHYLTSKPLQFTRQMLWELETKKAWDPKTYIPHVVKNGRSWGRTILDDGDELLVRSSQQKQWLNGEIYEDVFEEVYLNHKDQKATFLGTQHLKDPLGDDLWLQNQQPLFHVQHSVGGEEDRPVNLWRIVHLTKKKDLNLIAHFEKLNQSNALPIFIEIYIEKDLQISLTPTDLFEIHVIEH